MDQVYTPLQPLVSRTIVEEDPTDREEEERGRYSDSEDLESTEQGRAGLKTDGEDEEDDIEVYSDGRVGLLSGKKEEEEEEEEGVGVGVEVLGKRKDWLAEVDMTTKRRTVLISFAVLSTLALALFYHPAKHLVHHLTAANATIAKAPHDSSYTTLSQGTYNPTAIVGNNPLPSSAKFGDIPFAKVGGETPAQVAEEASFRALQEAASAEYWNGTTRFGKTVILISLDGVKASALEKGLTKHLVDVSRKGLRARFLQPVFPSLTFPNHWSILTGVYPAIHGIVANDFVDPDLSDEFVYTSPNKSWSPKWWGAEPIWSTAQKASFKTAVLMWPGPPILADGTAPTYHVPFKNHIDPSLKAAQIATWLDLPFEDRPNLIVAYAPEVDQEGHRSGPDSSKSDYELTHVDEFIKSVREVLQERSLEDYVDLVVVSDHGMTSTHNERLVFLDDILGEEGWKGVASNEGWPSSGLRFKEHINETLMLEKLIDASQSSKGGFHVYTPSTMPSRWHFTGNERIAPIYVIPHVGWAISNHHDFHQMGGDYVPKGNHGYDNADASMHAIFVAHGPFVESMKLRRRERRLLGRQAARLSPSPLSSVDDPAPLTEEEEEEEEITVIEGFANLEIYNLVAMMLGISVEQRAQTNGTVGFWEQYL